MIGANDYVQRAALERRAARMCATLGLEPRKQERVRRERAPSRNERVLECGYQAYALEEGHYDEGEVS